VKLLDFGLAKLLPQGGTQAFRTATGVVLGTPDYMAPELVRQRAEIDHRVDLYALGVMTFEMIAGRRPFVGHDGSLQKLQQIVDTPAPPLRELAPHAPAELAELVDALLAKAPEARPSLGEVRGVIKRLRSAAELPSVSFVAMEAAGTTVTDLPRAPMATPVTGVMSLARETVRAQGKPAGVVPPFAGVTDVEAAPLGARASSPAIGAAASSPAAVAPATSGLRASPASLPTEPLLPGLEPFASLRAPARPSSPPASMSGLAAAASHGGTVLGVAPPPAPPRPSASAIVTRATPARLNPAWVVLAVLAVLAAAMAIIELAIR
jgi:serine/threonine-protein kinase